jgi:nitrite reductase (cytochrome c-552)
MKYEEARQHVEHPIACVDCHEPESMAIRVTRPAFIRGIAAAKAAEGVEDYDVNKMATRHEMRTYVCAQCHVEYHFKGEKKQLTFPWDKGLTVDAALAFYDEAGFKDWVHAETGAPMLKAQHPEFELWSQGIHARSGVTCADCHMPYKRVGGTKISDHHVRSPLLNVNNACGTCHKLEDDELVARAELIQTRHRHLVVIALDALVDLIDDVKAAKEAGATVEQLAAAHDFQRKASFYVDYVEAENSSGFHAGQEAARILADSINFSRQGQNAVRDVNAALRGNTASADEEANEAAGEQSGD